MNSQEQIEIPFNRAKLTALIFGCIFFLVMGLSILIQKLQDNSFGDSTNVIVLALGTMAIIFFVAIATILLRKLFDKKPGLKITEQGILDKSSAFKWGLIPWSEIIEVKTIEVLGQMHIMLIVNDPQKYIDREPNPVTRFSMKMNHKVYGSAISISANILDINFYTLEKLIRQELLV
jgi:hypothetical protein